MEDNDRLCAVMSAVLGHTAQEELLDAALVVFSHYNSWSLKILSPFADDGTNGVLICVEVGDFNLVWNLGGFHFAYKPLFYEAFCCAHLLHRRDITQTSHQQYQAVRTKPMPRLASAQCHVYM